MNLELQFNGNIIKKIKNLSFQVDQIGSILFILFALYEQRYDLLDEFDDYNKQRRAFLLYKELEVRGLVARDENAEKGSPYFGLTKEGMILVEFIKGEFKNESNLEITTEKIAISGVESIKDEIYSEDPDTWIDAWIDIFPRGIKSGGRLLRSDKPSCLRKMKVFMREYKYTKDEIFAGTHAYIRSKEQENFNYTRCAVYFIYRVEGARADKTSDLATWCDYAKDKQIDDKKDVSGFEMTI